MPTRTNGAMKLWDVTRGTPHLTYLILTKRPELISKRLPADWGSGRGRRGYECYLRHLPYRAKSKVP